MDVFGRNIYQQTIDGFRHFLGFEPMTLALLYLAMLCCLSSRILSRIIFKYSLTHEGNEDVKRVEFIMFLAESSTQSKQIYPLSFASGLLFKYKYGNLAIGYYSQDYKRMNDTKFRCGNSKGHSVSRNLSRKILWNESKRIQKKFPLRHISEET